MNIRKYICFSLLIALLASCDKFLEPKLTNEFGDEITWGLSDYTTRMLLDAYNKIHQTPHAWNGNNYLDAVTDNSLTTHVGSSLFDFVSGTMSIHGNAIGNWGTCYDGIAIANLCIENMSQNPDVYDRINRNRGTLIKERTKGEALFLRAWFSHELLRNYGGLSADGQALGYVIANRTFKDDDADMEIATRLPRNTFEECVQQIFADCDSALFYLPMEYVNDPNNAVGKKDRFNASIDANHPFGQANYQRASGRACLALKSRVALLAASPAYQPANATAAEKREKWLRAAQLAQEALTRGNMGGLTGTNGMVPLETARIMGTTVSSFPLNAACHNEMLFMRTANNRASEQHHSPAWWEGNAKCNPSQNLVNAYPMANGYPITDLRSGYDPQDPYAGRDRRFLLQINYNFGRYCQNSAQRRMEIWGSADDGTIGRDGPGAYYTNTWTGYYIRKGMNDALDVNNNPSNPGATKNSGKRFGLLRRCEIWMNLAEALHEYSGPYATETFSINAGDDRNPNFVDVTTPTSIAIIRQLRRLYNTSLTNDVYLDEVAGSGKPEEFRDLILNERRLEFAFEGMRLWDLRRWRLPQISEDIQGVRIYAEYDRTVDEGSTIDGKWVPKLVRLYRFVYFGTDPNEEPIVVQSRSVFADPKYFTSPIPYGDMMKNPNLVQNAGWEMLYPN